MCQVLLTASFLADGDLVMSGGGRLTRLCLLLLVLMPLLVACESESGDAADTSSPGSTLESELGDVLEPSTPRSAFTAVWRGPDGQPAERGEGPDRSFEVTASEGPPHCNWETAVFLTVGWPLGTSPETAADTREYLRDPDGRVPEERLLGELDLDVEMPEDAQFTGYSTDEVELWFGPDEGNKFSYLKTGDGTERWPRAEEAIACG